MKFFQERINHRVQNGILPGSGQMATSVVEDQAERSDIILGNGTAAFNVRNPNDPTQPATAVTTVGLTTDFADNQYEINIANHSRVYVNVKVLDLGGVTGGVEVLIEFLDPDHINDDGSGLWIPSKEGSPRDAAPELQIQGPLPVGNYSLSSREEMLHFKKARVSFRAQGGTANASTRIHVSWHHDGKVAAVQEQ